MTSTLKKPTGPVKIAALVADIKAGKRVSRRKVVSIYTDPAARDRIRDIEQEIAVLDQTGPDPERGINETDHVEERRAVLEAQLDEIGEEFIDSRVDFLVRGEEMGDVDKADAAMAADGLDPKVHTEQRLAYVLAQQILDPQLSGDDLVTIVPIIGAGQFLKLLNTRNEMMAAPAPLSRKGSSGRATKKS